MAKRIVFGAALALVIVGLMAPSASANCPVGKSAGTYNLLTGAYTYWHTTLTDPGATLVAKMWQPGSSLDSTGTCNSEGTGILYFGANFATSGNIGLSTNLGLACAAACPSGSLAVMATVNGSDPADPLHRKQTQFLTSQAPETPGGALTFDFSTFNSPPHNMGAIPRPRITSSSKAGSIVSANVTVDAIAGSAFENTSGQFTGYNILSKLAGSDPGRLASAYTDPPALLASSNGGPASAIVSVDCTGGSSLLNRRFVVTQLVTVSGPSPTVSEATQVSCDGSLADPGKGYRIVPKPKVVPNSKAKR